MTNFMRTWSVFGTTTKYGHLMLFNDAPVGGPIIFPKWLKVCASQATDLSILCFSWDPAWLPITDPSIGGGAGDKHGVDGGGVLSTYGAMYGAIHPGIGGSQLITPHVQAMDTHTIDLDGWELPPGYGIGTRAGIKNTQIRNSYLWTE